MYRKLSLKIKKPGIKLKHSIVLPTSKSISNRMLILNSLLNHSFDIIDLSDAEDTQIMNKITSSLFHCSLVDVKNAGTCFRFLTALFASSSGEVILTGSKEMKSRPIKELVDALTEIGATISYIEKEGFPPLRIEGKKLQGGEVSIDASKSSQFISALLLIAPFLENGLSITQKGQIKSKSYTDMTISLLKKIGVEVEEKGASIKVNPLKGTFYSPLVVEKDWSSASYWYELIALSPELSKLQLSKLHLKSIQGDSIIADMFKQFGVTTFEGETGVEIIKTKPVKDFYFEANFSTIPDMVQTFVVTCVGLGINGKFKGISHLIYKETNRIEALKNEIQKMNYQLNMLDEDSFEIIKQGELPLKASVSTYKDHRMAMAFAPLSVVLEEIEIENPKVVEKSYPNFWNDFIGI